MAKKRANGEGSIRKRKDGCWEGRDTAGHGPEMGKATYKNVLDKTQAEAKEKLTSLDLQKFYKKLLTTGRVERLEAKRQPKGLGAKTVWNIHQIISSGLRLAQEQRLVPTNPAEGCALPRVEVPLKMKNAYRTLPLAEDTVSVLKEQRRKVGNSPWVFPSPNGGPISPDGVLHMPHLAVADFISLALPPQGTGLLIGLSYAKFRSVGDMGGGVWYNGNK